MEKDPVCGMLVDEKIAKDGGLASEYEGQKYFFCAAGCKERFAKKPDMYVGKTSVDWVKG